MSFRNKRMREAIRSLWLAACSVRPSDATLFRLELAGPEDVARALCQKVTLFRNTPPDTPEVHAALDEFSAAAEEAGVRWWEMKP